MYGLDISNWQKGIDLSKDNFDFCICKATEGVRFTDPYFPGFVSQLRALGKLIGAYHYARPDINDTPAKMAVEANFFCNEIEKNGLKGDAILAIDWETNKNTDREDLLRAWCECVEERMGVKPLIYTSKWMLTEYGKWDIWKEYGVWLAQWPTKQQFRVGNSGNIAFVSGEEIPWKIWQYSSNGTFNGYSGAVDLDYTPMTRDQWISIAEGTNSTLSLPIQWGVDNRIVTQAMAKNPNKLINLGEVLEILKTYDEWKENK